jgi:hypothetical protein
MIHAREKNHARRQESDKHTLLWVLLYKLFLMNLLMNPTKDDDITPSVTKAQAMMSVNVGL